MHDTLAQDMAQCYFDEVEIACGRIVSTSGERVSCSVTPTPYVIDGRTFLLTSPEGDFPFWLGLNGSRIFFIVYVSGMQPDDAGETFKFSFGGAMKVGWEFNYERLDGGVSMWGTCMVDASRPLSANLPHVGTGLGGARDLQLTPEGLFWAIDVAMMAQSWLRTCERESIRRHPLDPAPL